MTPDPQASRKADAITKLWEFKQLCDANVDNGMPMLHFSMLLRDQAYRDGMLNKAAASQDDKLKTVAFELARMKLAGPLRGSAPNGASSATLGAEGIALGGTGGGGRANTPRKSGSRSGPIWLIVGLLGLGLASLGGWFVLQQDGPKTISVTDNIMADTVWQAGNSYVLEQLTFVDAGAKLTIQPGVTVRGQSGSALVVTRDASIHARGRADAPIVFTSAQPLGQRRSGDWGGVVLLGNAPVNRDAHIEGIEKDDSRGDFGGSDAEGSCGVLEYARVEFAGFEISKDNELNGLTLGGCGAGTIVRNVQVHRGLDDGIEVFGGSVDLKNILITGPGDDAFDWDMGWIGRVQHLIIQMHPDTGDNAFEGDSNKSAHDAQPRSAPSFYNVTLIADSTRGKKHRGMTIRRGSGGHFHNMIITGFGKELVDIRDAASAAQFLSGAGSFGGILAHRIGADGKTLFPGENDDDGGFDEASYFAAEGRVEIVGSTGLGDAAADPLRPDFIPALVSYAMPVSRVPQGEFWDEGVDYFGAIRPGTTRNWTFGWSAFPAN